MMKHSITLFLLFLSFVSCSHIDESEQLIYVKPAAISRAVLIEDFTGQRCVNCPNATATIAQLQASYPEGSVVAVAIHSGDFARSLRGTPYPFLTEIGDEYYNYWHLDHQPVGMVNRQSPSEYSEWGTQVYNQLQQKASLELSIIPFFEEDSRNLSISVEGYGRDGDVDGKLQLWLTEDSLVAFQIMPDGNTNREYVHNHVFRTAVNGAWGTDFSTREGEYTEMEFQYSLPDDWDARHIHVVAFVYTDNGVEQVVEDSLIFSPQDSDDE